MDKKTSLDLIEKSVGLGAAVIRNAEQGCDFGILMPA
jgi:hypothetical protein